MRAGALVLAISAAALARPGSAPRAETLFIEGGTVVPVEGEPVPSGRIVVRDGKVSELGKDVERPAFSRRIDATGQWITPGFVVPTTRAGLPAEAGRGPVVVLGTGSGDEPARVVMEPGLKASDELPPRSEDLAFLLDQGITTVGLVPSGATGIPGQVSAVSTGAAQTELQAEAAVLVSVATHGAWRKAVADAMEKAATKAEKERPSDASKDGGGKDEKKDEPDPKARKRPAAAADEPERPAPPKGAAPAGKKGKPEAKPGKDAKEKPPESKKDRSSDPLVRLLLEQEPAFLVVSTPAGWTAARDVLPVDDMDVVVLDGIEIHRLAAELKEAGARVITYPALVRRPRTRIPVNRAAEYEAAGVTYAFTLPMDSARGAARLRDAAIEMARTGCSRAKVLAALTKEPAAMLGLGDQVGTIEKGRRADLLFWSGDPLDPRTRLERVMVGGAFVARTPRAGEAP